MVNLNLIRLAGACLIIKQYGSANIVNDFVKWFLDLVDAKTIITVQIDQRF